MFLLPSTFWCIELSETVGNGRNGMIVAPVEASPTKIAVENGSLKHIIYCVCILYIYTYSYIYSITLFHGIIQTCFPALEEGTFPYRTLWQSTWIILNTCVFGHTLKTEWVDNASVRIWPKTDFWVNYSNSLAWNKVILGGFSISTIVPVS